MVLDAMLSEASRLGDSIAERHAAAERFIAVAGALAGVGLTLGLKERLDIILVGLPIGLAIIILYMVQIYTDAGMHSGHRRALELHLEREFGQVVLVGQNRVATGHARRRSVALAPVLIFIVWIGTIALGGITVWSWYAIFGPWNTAYFAIYIALIAFALFVIFLAVKENVNAEKAAEKLASDAWL
ncbi:hypothetical protein [Pseudarthrobacter sp. W1I19]|uniref:hypothetical protein n=1 Tax=Pseudarthrobacter sp. W1I19 TaxID=3042288 RepID=UPI0027D859F0|nr:hypothetical protein [Pseudarthrobacter sp. W1I19]